jgi:carbonic anhydrase/acetyltransferase-like protein (isoleucine patch superfamily)
VIGDVEVGPQASVWFGCVIRGDVDSIRIGARSNLQDCSVIHVSSAGPGTEIGEDVTVGHRCILHACVVESGAFVGMGATVMDAAVIESVGPCSPPARS